MTMIISAADSGTAVAERLAFRADVQLERDGPSLRLTHRWGTHLIRRPSDLVAALLRRLTETTVTADELADGLLAADVALVHWTLERLQPLLTRTLWAGGQPLLTVTPIAPQARIAARTAVTGAVRLSRFTYVHRHGEGLVAESPLSLFRLGLCSTTAAQAVVELASLAGSARHAGEAPCADPTVAAVASWLVWTAMAESACDGDLAADDPAGDDTAGHHGGGRPRFAEDTDPVLRQWDFHDLLFHARSRLGRHDADFGATFKFLGELEPEPALRTVPAGRRIPLAKPDLAGLRQRDAPLAAVMEARCSVREYAEQPPRVAQLGELLYRTARVRAVIGPDPSRGMPYQASDRPYPSGGAAYDLEIYLTVSRCSGLGRGNYYYDPAGHQLVLLNQDDDAVRALLHRAYVSCGGAAVPDILLTFTSRFQRLGWKYRGMAYAATLKHVGVLYQSMYMVATAMGLAPCGLGSGDSDLSARAFGLDWKCESSVGEFMIGSRTADLDVHSAKSNIRAYQPVHEPPRGLHIT